MLMAVITRSAIPALAAVLFTAATLPSALAQQPEDQRDAANELDRLIEQKLLLLSDAQRSTDDATVVRRLYL
ncbi:MAG: hypothetical protein ACREJB_06125, partial [Planctomycetaceae bacterium]